jgi:hypothetical protein
VVSGFSRTSGAGDLRIAGLFVFRHDPFMRAEYAAALTNFLLVVAVAVGLSMASSSSGVHVYSDPTKAAIIDVLLPAMFAAPLALLAFWRTWVHAQRFQTRYTTGWQGVLEAAAMGFVLTLPAVLPGVVVRQFNPGEWGQPQAFFLGLAYVGIYGLLGAGVGLALGLLLRLSALAALRVHRRLTT